MARSAMTVSIIDSYGYGALIGGVVAYHLFPDFVGGKNEAMHHKGLADGKAVLAEMMKIRGDDRFIAGPAVSLADLYLAPIMAYVVLTPTRTSSWPCPGVAAWWDAMTARELQGDGILTSAPMRRGRRCGERDASGTAPAWRSSPSGEFQQWPMSRRRIS